SSTNARTPSRAATAPAACSVATCANSGRTTVSTSSVCRPPREFAASSSSSRGARSAMHGFRTREDFGGVTLEPQRAPLGDRETAGAQRLEPIGDSQRARHLVGGGQWHILELAVHDGEVEEQRRDVIVQSL